MHANENWPRATRRRHRRNQPALAVELRSSAPHQKDRLPMRSVILLSFLLFSLRPVSLLPYFWQCTPWFPVPFQDSCISAIFCRPRGQTRRLVFVPRIELETVLLRRCLANLNGIQATFSFRITRNWSDYVKRLCNSDNHSSFRNTWNMRSMSRHYLLNQISSMCPN